MEQDVDLARAIKEDEAVEHLFQLARRLEGLYRHASTHAAGVVIGDRPLDQLVALYQDPRAPLPATQYNMKWVEKAGLVKYDFLGLKTLTVLQRCVKLLAEAGIEVDLARIPLDDRRTFEMLARGDTTGVFQCDGSGVRDTLRRMRPDRLEDIIAVVALYRPGPMENIPLYIARKHGHEEPDYLHPMLEPVLKETFGIMVYQEQVMQAAQVLSGYSLGAADLLRRAMGKKIKEEMDAQRELFCNGAVEKGVDAATASNIFDQIQKFAGYGFNKSHAAAYALVAYQTAYLKANYPVEFFAATMTLDMGSTEKLAFYRQELMKVKLPDDTVGIELLPPDVNRSVAEFSVETLEDGSKAVRYALAAIRNVGSQAMHDLVAERLESGPFKGPYDLARRLGGSLNRRMLEYLAAAGALDELAPSRARAFSAAELLVKEAGRAVADRDAGQGGLFGGSEEADEPALPDVPDWPQMEKLEKEFSALGFYLSSHPLDAYDASLNRLRVVPSNDLGPLLSKGGKRVKLAGLPLGMQQRQSKKGKRFAFAQLTDRTGSFEIMVFEELLGAARSLLQGSEPLLISADGRCEEDSVRLAAVSIQPLDEAVSTLAEGLVVYLSDKAALPHLRHVLYDEKAVRTGAGKRGEVRLLLEAEATDVAPPMPQEVEVILPDPFPLTPALRGAIKQVPGVQEVRDL